jgi:hypothetical protein
MRSIVISISIIPSILKIKSSTYSVFNLFANEAVESSDNGVALFFGAILEHLH